ncbi:uncharacterized protein MONBRDRAFT_24369 [Monosiga brevicollis MX1]|uniref:Uncharacterized protein n=1 Tax=Monosiga brevicollis TaxID=81824 RepID=A9UW76_MONBE|nr:uncharacterized protein MONBRDRAFT_24369 [Monosiga brevicollis MX1]EDQ90514.1 predicted protein [Monosiga brevicollis MX1]|eukprot:XP_001744565.1 hypothetical protein [Monosiga brevicollis MX1]
MSRARSQTMAGASLAALANNRDGTTSCAKSSHSQCAYITFTLALVLSAHTTCSNSLPRTPAVRNLQTGDVLCIQPAPQSREDAASTDMPPWAELFPEAQTTDDAEAAFRQAYTAKWKRAEVLVVTIAPFSRSRPGAPTTDAPTPFPPDLYAWRPYGTNLPRSGVNHNHSLHELIGSRQLGF